MNTQKYIFYCLLAAGLFSACKENYEPPVIKTNLNLLVVDGFLNNGPDTTRIRLSRTRKLDDGIANSAETKAQIVLEDANGGFLYGFTEMEDGNYIVPGMNLDVTRKYKLRIYTNSGKQYASGELSVKNTPPVDSISWRREDDLGVRIYVNTHDPGNNTKYYRWDYTETWEYNSSFFSSLKYENNMILARPTVENIYYCWNTRNSTNLFLGSSAKLSEDRINMLPLRYIPYHAVELGIKYSILVKQYALTKEGYDYFQNLKKITEGLGSIFDAQPSQLTGNIHSVDDPSETVIGFMQASTLTEQRIFIGYDDVKPWVIGKECEEKIFFELGKENTAFGDGVYIPIVEVYNLTGILIGYFGAVPSCVDCRTKGGINRKPDYWP